MALIALLLACVSYRTYPLLQLDPPGRGAFAPTGVALLPDDRVVVSSGGDAIALYAPEPDLPLVAGGVLAALPLRTTQDVRGRRTAYRAGVRLSEQPIRWLPRGQRQEQPYGIEDLAPFVSANEPDRAERVLAVTAYSAVGARSGYRKDFIARSRVQTEQLVVLERRTEDGRPVWQEVRIPEIERLRASLSDWGRATCAGDMRVEGLAYDASSERVYVGLRRCDGPVARVLRWDLRTARQGGAVALEVEAEGIRGGAGPEEGVSALAARDGALWALTAWDGYGYATEPAFGGRLHRVRNGLLQPEDLSGPFLDRPSGLGLPAAGGDPLVVFDNGEASGARDRPNLTLLRARLPRPADGRHAELRALERVDGTVAAALNGFDMRWWVRDHRLSFLGVRLDREPPDHAGPGEAGAWSRAIGGLWQVRVGGTLGLLARGVPLLDKRVGHNRQAVAFTDYAGTGLDFTGYRATVSVVPRDRERSDPSVARLMADGEAAYRTIAPLPVPASAQAGLVLQGFEVDTSARNDRGICVAGLDIGVDWATEARDAVAVQTTVVGGLCNDFDARGPDYLHGTTTAVDGGVRVVVHFAVVEGARAETWGVRAADADVPGPRAGPGESLYARDPLRALGDREARNHVHCVSVDRTGGVTRAARPEPLPPPSWVRLDARADAVPDAPASLRRFALALDPVGFDPALAPRPLTEEESLDRNNYVYRYLLRAFPTAGGAFVEGGLTHGIHPAGPMRDNARPSALAIRAELTAFPGAVGASTFDTRWPRRSGDPNLRPEDGFIRWSAGRPLDEEPACSPSW